MKAPSLHFYSAIRRIAALLGLLTVLLLGYWRLVRPAQLHWGATDADLKRAMPEDDTVTDPAFDATRAITIHGRPEQVWPWLVQMGYGRAGFYGYDLIENPGSGAGLRSADRILPALQNPHTGDMLPLSIAATLAFGTVEPNRCMVWRGREVPPSGVFIWQLVPVDAEHTRLISRIRWRYLKSPMGVALGGFTEFADHVAVKAILRGLRSRVEGQPGQSLTWQAVEIGAWLLTMVEFGVSCALVVAGRCWTMAWWLALASGIFLQIELYATPPAAVTAALPVLLLGGMAWGLASPWRAAGQRQVGPRCIAATTKSSKEP